MNGFRRTLSIVTISIFIISFTLFCLVASLGATVTEAIPDIPGFYIAGAQKGPWPDILGSFGLREQAADKARIIVLPEEPATPADHLNHIQSGRIVILQGDSPLGRSFGIRPTSRRVQVRKVIDGRDPKLPVVWQKAIEVPVFDLPANARVLVTDQVHKTPLMAIVSHDKVRILWMAISPGTEGYERFPFLLHALSELGVRPFFESRRLWAFYDPAFQRDRNIDELASQWRRMGLSAVHVGAWDYFYIDDDEDQRLNRLIDACHREGILVYAWLELPHVSQKFWKKHPQWREKTARLKDAHIDWRYLMNLTNPDCQRAVIEGVRGMLGRFDWDGVNFAELYFDGVRGIKDPDDLTPFNADVRREVKATFGFDPVELFRNSKPDAKKMRTFLDYRADLAARIQETWIDELEKMRLSKPHLDLVLTHVDDRFDTTMRDAIGADAARLLKTLDSHNLTFIIEDPYTLWHLGPKRYREIAQHYRPLTSQQDRLGVDINIVKRAQGYPTSQQTGVELAQLIHTASESFATVMFYYTGSITPNDAPLLPVASAVITRCEPLDGGLLVESPYGVGLAWPGPVTVDGRQWPVRDTEHVWVPAGRHILRPSAADTPNLVTDFTGNLEGASVVPDGLEITYNSQSRAFARLNRKPARLYLDGQEVKPEINNDNLLRLPRGAHKALITW